MERLTRKLKKGGYSANRHPAAQIDERLSQLKGVHKQWVGDVSDMITGMKQSEAAGQAGKLEDLYEQCVSELEDAKAGLDECRENGFQDDLAYGELMVTKLGLTQLTKQFDIATGYAEPDPEPYQYQPKTDTPAE